eukprot:CAMPEP_0113312110 /NCGR_PEP_ID=MMETSP0010_2-20120614/9068_1 /TAXON_ID=216773 ORGANISM="Corethron hystrix, Strain 308" /NCGR_SAMPLE_ID=MMETSP0010_2 /ASSEMBLY_ACC=CAM_ASM_000155 /LENGTH=254 /DNA_ID=CAMNT_0000167863 /DNA_START=291 /DNA_END=1055 /DNA_ORIENTATION=- /assembly_acc=CAM_ASM_000155
MTLTAESLSQEYNLTPDLAAMTSAFASIDDDKVRYKQLMFLANRLPAMEPALMVSENKVQGCLSTVYVDATPSTGDDGRTLIAFSGDSDGVLTKGLVALLVRGLSGNTASDIEKVVPDFIKAAGIAQTLTPGRNNGFLNMLALMKQKAHEAENGGKVVALEDDLSDTSANPIHNAILTVLSVLQPTSMNLTESSHDHAGSKELDGENRFNLVIVADCFGGLSANQRQELIYTLLGDLMTKISSLDIIAKSPSEV